MNVINISILLEPLTYASRLAGLINCRLMVYFFDVTMFFLLHAVSPFLLHSFPTRVTGGLQWRWSAYPVNLDTFELLCLSHIDLTIGSGGNTVGRDYPTKWNRLEGWWQGELDMFRGELRLEVHRDGKNQHALEPAIPCYTVHALPYIGF